MGSFYILISHERTRRPLPRASVSDLNENEAAGDEINAFGIRKLHVYSYKVHLRISVCTIKPTLNPEMKRTYCVLAIAALSVRN